MSAIEYQPLTTILLTGSLAKQFGREHKRALSTGNVREAFKALGVTLGGFNEAVNRLANLGMRFAIFRNRKNVGESEFERGGVRELRIVPVIEGSKRAGVLQTIVGAVLVIAGYAFSGVTGGSSMALVPIGGSLIAGGVIQMLSPQASGLRTSASPDNQPSYAFGSAKNTTASGLPVPICIGERRWGGAIISASIYAEDKV